MRVARYASPREEETYGPTLLDAAVSYMEAKYGVIEDSLPIAFDRLKIPVTREGKERRLLLAECTVVDVTARPRRGDHVERWSAADEVADEEGAEEACNSRGRRSIGACCAASPVGARRASLLRQGY